MISTIESKQQQLINGFFQRGSGREQSILILGSCRTLPYLSYLIRWNEAHAEPFTIRRIDVCDWTVSGVDIASLETDERILKALASTQVFIHEHLESYGMFNTVRAWDKNIYKFGMNPELEIAIPNFHDHFILENDYMACGLPTPEDYIDRGEAEIDKFCKVCEMSSFPEMSDYFRDNWRKKRFFWRPNHVSVEFTMYVFRRMNSRFLHLNLTEEFLNAAKQEDLFKSPCTEVTQRDVDGYGLEWR